MSIRVLVADDQELVRSALRVMIERRAGLSVVGEAADGQEAVAAAFVLRPDVVLMDVRMPGLTGVEATGRILRDWPHGDPRPRVLMLTTFDVDEYVHASLRAGASGFLLKNSSSDQLADAIRTVAAGEAMLAPTVTRRLIGAFTTIPEVLLAEPRSGTGPRAPRRTGRLGALTARESEVLILVARGLSNVQIARSLGLSEAGVKSRVNRILTRLGLENRVQAAILAYEAGLLEGPARDASG
ncbi:DNA-binding NarL/FixJ family response regulator [Streptosporangium becharense]|uniref:DNA-binding NarL/FixJ family response regulator n=1 Tax=Streptosporangium becharense TaxID=1816182 RepID=A0A7W9IH76_9ACTN|nr:response regulator transcription factor [Streptosporangium becharense]MBB2914953.1 DNA-binding NarL/FixJ family response regulator [Streptosporangium becharense]MBB5820236.1 DNA-binding NarL/FixJ family response regulator [Streptosporangium becharense]